jgi:hypothetical protein
MQHEIVICEWIGSCGTELDIYRNIKEACEEMELKEEYLEYHVLACDPRLKIPHIRKEVLVTDPEEDLDSPRFYLYQITCEQEINKLMSVHDPNECYQPIQYNVCDTFEFYQIMLEEMSKRSECKSEIEVQVINDVESNYKMLEYYPSDPECDMPTCHLYSQLHR